MSNKLQQTNIFTWGLVLTWSLITTVFAFFLFCLFQLYITVRGLYGRNPENFPILFIDSISMCTFPHGPSHSSGLLCSFSYSQIGATSSFPQIFQSWDPLLLHHLSCCSPDHTVQLHLFLEPQPALAKAKAGALWHFLAGNSLHKAH